MNDGADGRAAPRVIFVPPPRDLRLPPRRVLGPLVACAFGTGMVALLATVQGQSPQFWLLLMLPVWVVVLLIVVLHRAHVHRRVAEQRSDFLRQRTVDEQDPRVQALARCWNEADRPPRLNAVRAALAADARVPAEDAADVVAFGEPTAPEVGALRFEPVVLTPTETLWRQFIWLGIGGFIIIWWLLGRMPFMPFWFPRVDRFMSGLMYFVIACVVTLGVWAWRTLLRPGYIRLAPGMIQFLEYRYAGGQPTVRSYPLERGTLVTLVRQRKRLTVYLSRDNQWDEVPLWQMRKPDEMLERVWQAVLSTAPTPPLSAEDLQG